MPATPSVPVRSLSPLMWRVRRGQQGVGVPLGSICHLHCGHHPSFLCMWPPPLPLHPYIQPSLRGLSLLYCSTHPPPLKLLSSSVTSSSHGGVHLFVPSLCMSLSTSALSSIHMSIHHESIIHGSSIPAQTHLSISAHIPPSISFSWIHPSHLSQNTPISLSPYSNIPFFLVDSPITHPSQLTSISPSLLTPLHLSIPCGFINPAHTYLPISLLFHSFCPCEFTHLICHSSCPSLHLLSCPPIHPFLVDSSIAHPLQLTFLSLFPLTPLHASHPSASTHLVHLSTYHLSISSHTLPSILSLCIIHLIHLSACPTHHLLSNSASH